MATWMIENKPKILNLLQVYANSVIRFARQLTVGNPHFLQTT